MKYFNKFLLLLFSVLVLFGVSINTYNYAYAEDVNINDNTDEGDEINYVSQEFKFVDKEGNIADLKGYYLDDSNNLVEVIEGVTFARYVDYDGVQVIEPVLTIDGLDNRTDEAYDYGKELSADIYNGITNVDGLIKGETYLIFFNYNHVFKQVLLDEENQTENIDYYWYGSFVAGENETIEISVDDSLESVYNADGTQNISDEELEEITMSGDVMPITMTTYFRGQCAAASSDTVKVEVTKDTSCTNYNTYTTCGYVKGNGTISCTVNPCGSNSGSFYYKITGNGGTKTGITGPGGSIPIYCSTYGYGTECSSSASCSNITVYQTYDGNGGNCDYSSSSRTKSGITKACNKGYWGSCSGGSWSGSVSAPSCSRGNGTDTRTISFNKNVASDSASQNVTGTDSKQISRTIYYSHNGWSNYSTTFTSNQTAYAQWSTSYGSWSTITLPVATRTGYTFKGWEYGGTTYSAGTTVDPQSDRTYTAQW